LGSSTLWCAAAHFCSGILPTIRIRSHFGSLAGSLGFLLHAIWASLAMAGDLSPSTPWRSVNKCSAARRAWGLTEVANVARKCDCLLSAMRIRPQRHSGPDPKPLPSPIFLPLGFEKGKLRCWGLRVRKGEWKIGRGGRMGSLPEFRCGRICMANKTQPRSVIASLPQAAVDVLESGSFNGTSLVVLKSTKGPERTDLKQNKAWIMGVLQHFPSKACCSVPCRLVGHIR